MGKVKDYTPPGYSFALGSYCEDCPNFDPILLDNGIIPTTLSASPYSSHTAAVYKDGYSNNHIVSCSHMNYCERLYRYLTKQYEKEKTNE